MAWAYLNRLVWEIMTIKTAIMTATTPLPSSVLCHSEIIRNSSNNAAEWTSNSWGISSRSSWYFVNFCPDVPRRRISLSARPLKKRRRLNTTTYAATLYGLRQTIQLPHKSMIVQGTNGVLRMCNMLGSHMTHHPFSLRHLVRTSRITFTSICGMLIGTVQHTL